MVIETNTEAIMQTLHVLSINESMDGMGPSKTLFACAELGDIVDWLRKKFPKCRWEDIDAGCGYQSYMYTSVTVSTLSLMTLEDLQAADAAAEEVKQLESRVAYLQDQIAAKKKIAL